MRSGIVVGLFVSALLSAAACQRGEPTSSEAPPAGSDAIGASLAAFDFPTGGGETLRWPATPQARITVLHVFQPDCLACRDEARALQRLATEEVDDATVLGVASLGAQAEVDRFRSSAGVTYPLAVATGSEWAKVWGAGDPTYVIDAQRIVRYRQVGFHPSDLESWRGVVRALAAGTAPESTGPSRSSLVKGEPMPPIELPDLDGVPLRLVTEEGRLRFHAGGQSPRACRAAIGFFSRY